MIYIRGALYVLCMAINRLYPNAKIRTEYQLHNAMYINITNLELTDDMIKDIEDGCKKPEITLNLYPEYECFLIDCLRHKFID